MKRIGPFHRLLLGGAILGSIAGICLLLTTFHQDSDGRLPPAAFALLGFIGAVLGTLTGAFIGAILRLTEYRKTVFLIVGLVLLGIFVGPIFDPIICTLGPMTEESNSELPASAKVNRQSK